MNIQAVCERYHISQDTLRYYEKAGIIPAVSRTKGGKRDYREEDLKWVENAICMRNAGLSIEMLAEYVRLFQEGNDTFSQRRDLLIDAREQIQKQKEEIEETLSLLDYKISRYEEAVKTGVLTRDEKHPR